MDLAIAHLFLARSLAFTGHSPPPLPWNKATNISRRWKEELSGGGAGELRSIRPSVARGSSALQCSSLKRQRQRYKLQRRPTRRGKINTKFVVATSIFSEVRELSESGRPRLHPWAAQLVSSTLKSLQRCKVSPNRCTDSVTFCGP